MNSSTKVSCFLSISPLVSPWSDRFFFSSRRRHTSSGGDWSSDVCSSDLFGVKASENLNVVGFSEVVETSNDDLEGGAEDTMTTTIEENADTFLSELGLSEDEVKARLSRYEELERENKKNRIDQKVREWEDNKKSPALVTAAKAILMADDGAVVLHLSEDGNDKALTAADIVDRLVAAAPIVSLADDPITDEDANGEAPPDDTTEENLSDEVKAEADRLFLYERYSEEDAVVEAKRRIAEKDAQGGE